jgi:hypothetical protein
LEIFDGANGDSRNGLKSRISSKVKPPDFARHLVAEVCDSAIRLKTLCGGIKFSFRAPAESEPTTLFLGYKISLYLLTRRLSPASECGTLGGYAPTKFLSGG